jgi:metal transporter CNNM
MKNITKTIQILSIFLTGLYGANSNIIQSNNPKKHDAGPKVPPLAETLPGQSIENRPTTTLLLSLTEALSLLESLGIEGLGGLCHPYSDDYEPIVPFCEEISDVRSHRYLPEDEEHEEISFADDKWFFLTHAACALACVLTAALAAGLTMGLLSLDPLLLLIKIRAGATPLERKQAAALLPIVNQHHLLLVTLLLLNSMANEALPLFLEVLVSPVVAVILSVTFVLFFGEIIPSAIFTGPKKIELAYRMSPLVKLVMFLLWPLAYPIAKVLDTILHDDEHDSSAFNRGELAALVRIQYEERMAQKQQRKKERASVVKSQSPANHVGGLDFSSVNMIAAEVRASKREAERNLSRMSVDSSAHIQHAKKFSQSIHVDEVSMVEGALSMKTKVAIDVYTPFHRVFAVSYDMIMNERNVVSIYSSGFSRVPVYDVKPNKPKDRTAIRGILKTKHLMVVNPQANRPLSTLPLYCPMCVSPKMNLVDLLNLFQTGTAGHLALVCARPNVASEALANGKSLPESAGLMGVITIEDVIEAILQEQIYDESDKLEREATRIAKWATRKWKNFVRDRKQERTRTSKSATSTFPEVVNQVVKEKRLVREETPLLPSDRETEQARRNEDADEGSGNKSGFLGFFGLA